MNPNSLSFNDLFSFITMGLNRYEGMFIAYGLVLETAFVAIILVLFWAQSLLSGTIRWDRFGRLVMMVLGVHFALTNYSLASHLITSETQFLANQINGTLSDQVVQRLYLTFHSMETPSIAAAVFNVVEVARWLITLLCILAAAFAIYAVIGLSYALQGVAVMLGPVLLPWFLFPGMNWIAWGWIKALVVTSFIQVVAACYLFTMGQVLIATVDRIGTDLSAPQVAMLFFVFPVMLLSFTYGMLRIPSFTNDLFSGRGGYTVYGG